MACTCNSITPLVVTSRQCKFSFIDASIFWTGEAVWLLRLLQSEQLCTDVLGDTISLINPLKVCHTKIDRMRSMGVCPLNSVVCRRMATNLPMKLPNVFLYAKLKSFRGVHIQLPAEIGG